LKKFSLFKNKVKKINKFLSRLCAEQWGLAAVGMHCFQTSTSLKENLPSYRVQKSAPGLSLPLSGSVVIAKLTP
jgi:hypothetical protein